MSREEAYNLVGEYDPAEPAALKYYLEITGCREEFFDIMADIEEMWAISDKEIQDAILDFKRKFGDKKGDRDILRPERVETVNGRNSVNKLMSNMFRW